MNLLNNLLLSPEDDNNSENQPPNPDPTPTPPVRTFTQEEVNRLVGEARTQARTKSQTDLLTQLNVANPEEALTLISSAREAAQANLTELERVKQEAEAARLRAEEAQRLADEREQALRAERRNTALSLQLAQAGAVDVEAAVLLINQGDTSALLNEDGTANTAAITSAVEALKKSKTYLFTSSNYKGLPSSAGSNPSADAKAKAAEQAMRDRINHRR